MVLGDELNGARESLLYIPIGLPFSLQALGARCHQSARKHRQFSAANQIVRQNLHASTDRIRNFRSFVMTAPTLRKTGVNARSLLGGQTQPAGRISLLLDSEEHHQQHRLPGAAFPRHQARRAQPSGIQPILASAIGRLCGHKS